MGKPDNPEGCPCHAHGYESVAVVPIRSDGHIIGLLQLNDGHPGMFDLPLIHFFEELTTSLGVAFKRQQTEERVRMLLNRQTQINRMTLNLGLTLDLEQTYQTIYEHIYGLLDTDTFTISLYDTGNERLTTVFAATQQGVRDVSQVPPDSLQDGGGRMQRDVIRSGEPVLVCNWHKATIEESARCRPPEDGIIAESALQPDASDGSDVIRSAALAPMKVEGQVFGVLQIQSHRPSAYDEEDLQLLAGLANVAASAIRNAQLVDIIERDTRRLETILDGTIQALSRATEIRDPYTAGHQRRVTELVLRIADHLGLDKSSMDDLRMAGLLHDIGKMSVPAEILVKPTTLSDVERQLLAAHPQVGFDILKSAEAPYRVTEIVLQHHERLDGSGYPRGIRAEAILREARILSVADVVEAMSSHRPYRPALGIEAALEEVSTKSGTLYDPEVVEACVAVFKAGFTWSEQV
jgi:putative nucleotidyltransferase with HDIG domain